jgi:hypothetical protein
MDRGVAVQRREHEGTRWTTDAKAKTRLQGEAAETDGVRRVEEKRALKETGQGSV